MPDSAAPPAGAGTRLPAEVVAAAYAVGLDRCPVGIALLDRELRVVFANSTFSDLYHEVTSLSGVTGSGGDVDFAAVAAKVRQDGTAWSGRWLDRDFHLFPTGGDDGLGWVGCALGTPSSHSNATPSASSGFALDEHLLAAVMHDLRTPIAAMLLWQQALRQQSSDTDLQRRAIQAMATAASEAARLLDDLRDFALLRRGRFELDLALFEIETELATVLAEKSAQAAKKPLTVTSHYGPDLGATTADRQLVRRALTIAIGAAMDASPPTTAIDVMVERTNDVIEIQVTCGGGNSHRFITDSRHRPTDLQASVSYRGIDMALVRAIMESHGGTFWVSDNRLGLGTTLRLTLPAQRRLEA